MTNSGLTILQRKAGADRPVPDHGVMTLAKAVRLSVAGAGEDVLGLPVQAGSVEEARLTIPKIPDLIEDTTLAVILEGGILGRGLALLDAPALTVLLQALATGRVLPAEEPDDDALPTRAPTATDAFLCRGFLEQLLTGFVEHLKTVPENGLSADFTPGDQLRDPRNLPLVLEDVAFRMISAQIMFGSAMREGRLMLILPWVPQKPALRALPPPQDADGDIDPEAAQDPAPDLGEAELALDIVLHRIRMPLSRVASLQPGEYLRFPVHALSALSIVDAAGDRIASGQLGQARGHRAVRLVLDPDDATDIGPLQVGAASGRPAESPEPMPAMPEPEMPSMDLEDPAMAAPIGGLPDIDLGSDEVLTVDDLPDLPDLPTLIE